MKKTTKTTTPKPLTQQQLAARQKAANTFWSILNKRGTIDTLANLQCRWQDEKQYEDIKDYEKVFASALTALVKKGVIKGKMVKFSSLPFGFIFSLGQVAGDELQVKITVNSREAKMVFGRRLK